jgi:hypothetical protein
LFNDTSHYTGDIPAMPGPRLSKVWDEKKP